MSRISKRSDHLWMIVSKVEGYGTTPVMASEPDFAEAQGFHQLVHI
jgi:hypothetical protein